jgi:hypothetical protein
MAKPDGRIEKGQRLSTAISARRWNDLCDAADVVQGRRPGVQAGNLDAIARPYTWVYVRNESVSLNTPDIERWQPVHLVGIWNQSYGFKGTEAFDDVPVLSGANSVQSGGSYAWGVAVEPIADGAIGKVAVSGIVKSKVRTKYLQSSPSTFPRFVRPDLNTKWLQHSHYPSGGLAVHIDEADLTTENDNALTWAIIRLGDQQGIRRGIVRGGWANGSKKTIEEAQPFVEIPETDDGETRYGVNDEVTVYQRQFEAYNFLATLDAGQERWVYCALIGGVWELIGFEVVRQSWKDLEDSTDKNIFT